IQTKEWMRACYREGVVPLLQMHDSLDLSVSSPDIPEMVARLGVGIIKLDVPMKVDVNYGRTWGDAKHTWAELTGSHVELIGEISDTPALTAREVPKLSSDFDDAPDSALADDIDVTTEPPHICIHCHRNPPDGTERVSAYNEAWLHPQCEEPFVRARMAE